MPAPKNPAHARTRAVEPTAEPIALKTGADILVEALEREGVDVLFAYPGGSSMPIHQALTRSKKIRVILARHEQGEAFEAGGYARATGRTGVCIATSGPGATNLVTGIADAKLDSIPLVAITGQVPTKVIGTDAFQEVPTVEICRSITKHATLIQSIDSIPQVVKDSFHIASTGRRGPVLIDLPKDIQQASAVPSWPEKTSLRSYNPFLRATPEELDRIREAVASSRRPVIYCGGGVVSSGASEALRAFVRATGIPVTATLMGLGAFPSDDPLFLGMLGMHGTYAANWAIAHADLLLALGTRFDDRVTGKLDEFASQATIAHVEIDPSEINKIKRAHLAVASDVRYALEALAGVARPCDCAPWRGELEKKCRDFPMRFVDSEDTIKPQYLLRTLSDRLRGDAIVVTGVGQHQMWSAQWISYRQPRSFITSGGLGAMGFGLPAAIGAQIGRPDALVVNVDGDGSFLMNIQELAVVNLEKIPLKMMILDNQHLGMVVQWEDRFFAGNHAHTYLGDGSGTPYPDFIRIASGFGIPGRRVTRKKDVPAALDAMLNEKGPFLLDVMTDRTEHVLPMIPSGKSIRDVIQE
ncbi:MAG: biosynthetic-type acetolactate synthase large subunit [Planctomycetota bacterium]